MSQKTGSNPQAEPPPREGGDLADLRAEIAELRRIVTEHSAYIFEQDPSHRGGEPPHPPQR